MKTLTERELAILIGGIFGTLLAYFLVWAAYVRKRSKR